MTPLHCCMTGKRLIANLKWLLDPYLEIPVYVFDRNADREMPCVIIGFDNEEPSIAGNQGHYKVSGSVVIAVQGYEDSDNSTADEIADEVVDLLCDKAFLETALNPPSDPLDDDRPEQRFGLSRLFVRGVTRDEQDHSTFVSINFDAFCVLR